MAVSEPFDVCVIRAGAGVMLDRRTAAVFRVVSLGREPHRVADPFARPARDRSR